MNRVITYTQAIREAIDQSMDRDPSLFVIGLGVTYPNGGDGTTAGLVDKYPDRVFDMPCSEGTATGFCVGSAITGMRPILVHGRVEFSLLGFDQIVTQAAKWHYLFQTSVPITIRVAVGRRWGDGPQHTQSLHSIFSHIPGLKVLIPSTPFTAKGLLTSALIDKNPVVFMEHRWLYNISQSVPDMYYTLSINQSRIIKQGSDVTLITNADTLIEALRCLPAMISSGIEPEIIDLISINPLDYDTILTSVNKTKRLIIMDVGFPQCGIGSEIISTVCKSLLLQSFPIDLSARPCPCPTTPALSEHYYPTDNTLIHSVSEMFDVPIAYERTPNFREIHLPSSQLLPDESGSLQ